MILSLIGLLLNISGTVVIFFFGVSPALNQQGAGFLVVGENEDYRLKYRKYRWLARAGIILIFIGFILQFIDLLAML
jgi:hypothetical protein